MFKNPYPDFISDEASGVAVPNDKHQLWEEGFKAGIEEVVEFKCEECSTPNFVHFVVPKAKLEAWRE